MHSNSLGCPKIFPLSAPVLTGISSLKAKNERKTLIYTQLKTSRSTNIFSLFLEEFLELYLRPIFCSQTTTRIVCPVPHEENVKSDIYIHPALWSEPLILYRLPLINPVPDEILHRALEIGYATVHRRFDFNTTNGDNSAYRCITRDTTTETWIICDNYDLANE